MTIQEIHAVLNTLLAEQRLQNLYRTVRELFELQGSIGHGWEHVRRVVVNAAWIGTEENARMDIVLPAAILHDIGFVTNPDEPKKHPEHGARECRRYLTEWSPDHQDRIARSVLRHKSVYPGYNGIEPQTLEEKVVCDADQVDKFGWLGITQMVRVYTEYGLQGREEYRPHGALVDALQHATSIRLYTQTGRRIAEERNEPSHRDAAHRLAAELTLSETWQDPC